MIGLFCGLFVGFACGMSDNNGLAFHGHLHEY